MQANGSVSASLDCEPASTRMALTAGTVTNSASAPGRPVMPCSPYCAHWCESPVAQYSHSGRPSLTQLRP